MFWILTLKYWENRYRWKGISERINPLSTWKKHFLKHKYRKSTWNRCILHLDALSVKFFKVTIIWFVLNLSVNTLIRFCNKIFTHALQNLAIFLINIPSSNLVLCIYLLLMHSIGKFKNTHLCIILNMYLCIYVYIFLYDLVNLCCKLC